MRTTILAYLLFFAVFCSAQSIPNSGFLNPQPVPCPADTTQTVMGYPEWEAYQTFNDKWDGPIDTTICIDIGQTSSQATIPFYQTDLNRKVFLRSKMDSSTFPQLQPHFVYSIVDDLNIPLNMTLDTSSACPNGMCSGAITVVEVPDSSGLAYSTREYKGALTNDWISTQNFNTCFASEKFVDQKVIEHILSFKTISMGADQELVVDRSRFASWLGDQVVLNDGNIESARSGQFEYPLLNQFTNFIVAYQETSYPSPDSVSYLELTPDPNVSTQSMIDLTIGSRVGLHYELFAQFQGALVLGDTIRHNINVINYGEQCVSSLVEIVWNGGNRFTFAGGNVDFGGASACFQFGSGGTLAVADNATFNYGAPGRGILALRTGAEVEIGRDAELIIYNKLYLQEYWEETQSQNIEMTLGQGSRLTFAPGACIDNSNSISQNMKLVVYLDGGFVDLNGLSPTDRDKVIVKRLAQESETALTLFGSIASDQLEFELLTRSFETAELNIFSSNGAYIKSVSVVLEKGPNRILLDLSGMSNGLYILEAIHGDRKETVRFVKGS